MGDLADFGSPTTFVEASASGIADVWSGEFEVRGWVPDIRCANSGMTDAQLSNYS